MYAREIMPEMTKGTLYIWDMLCFLVQYGFDNISVFILSSKMEKV